MSCQSEPPFENFALPFALREPKVTARMRANLQSRSFKVWRKWVRG